MIGDIQSMNVTDSGSTDSCVITTYSSGGVPC